jgi:hypothetical protein
MMQPNNANHPTPPTYPASDSLTDRSLEGLCPSIARAVVADEEPISQESALAQRDSSVDRVRSLLTTMTGQFTPLSVAAENLPRFVQDISAVQPELLAIVREFSATPTIMSSLHQLDERAFDRAWGKLLNLQRCLEQVFMAYETRSPIKEHLPALHASLLDATMEFNRIAERNTAASSEVRAHEASPLALTRAQLDAVQGCGIPRGDETTWTNRGV